MLKAHRAPKPNDRDQVQVFYLDDGRQKFTVMLSDGDEGWISVAPEPDGDFSRFHAQTVKTGGYLVRIDRHSLHPEGRLARKLVQEFVRNYDAADISF